MNRRDEYFYELVSKMARIQKEHIFVFDNRRSFSVILRDLTNIDWIEKLLNGAEDYEHKVSLFELYYFDISIEGKTYVFVSPSGLETWQAALIVGIFYVALKVSPNSDEITMYNYFRHVDTLIVAYFLSIFGAEESYQSLRVPRSLNLIVNNDRFVTKIEIGGFLDKASSGSILALYRILQKLIELANSTNEGKPIKFNALYFPDRTESSICGLIDLYKQHFPTNLCSSKNSLYHVDTNGNVFMYSVGEVAMEEVSDFRRFKRFSSQDHKPIVEAIRSVKRTRDDEAVYGVCLEEDGSIYLLGLSGVIFYFRKRQWNFAIHPSFAKATRLFESEEIINSIYDFLLAGKGCCIGVLPTKKIAEMKIEEDQFYRAIGVLDQDFTSIPPQLRLEIGSIDGAVLLEENSYLVKGIAQILPVEKSKNEGARTGAAKYLARHGLVGIKVSEDGFVDVYTNAGEDACDLKMSFGRGYEFEKII